MQNFSCLQAHCKLIAQGALQPSSVQHGPTAGQKHLLLVQHPAIQVACRAARRCLVMHGIKKVCMHGTLSS